MRLAAVVVLLAAPLAAEAQPGPAVLPIDLMTGRGSVTAQWVRSGPFNTWLFPSDYTANIGKVSWYFVVQDEYGGEIIVTPPGGKPFPAEAPTRAIRRQTYPLGAVASADGVTFTGYTGGATITGAIPKAGDPYTGLIPGPAGSSAVWSKPVVRERFAPLFEIFGTIGGTQSTSMAYWRP